MRCTTTVILQILIIKNGALGEVMSAPNGANGWGGVRRKKGGMVGGRCKEKRRRGRCNVMGRGKKLRVG